LIQHSFKRRLLGFIFRHHLAPPFARMDDSLPAMRTRTGVHRFAFSSPTQEPAVVAGPALFRATSRHSPAVGRLIALCWFFGPSLLPSFLGFLHYYGLC
jgi:hypothetical protein